MHEALKPQVLPTRTRSAIPKVIGILAIVFASLGIVGSLAMAFGFDEELARWGVTRHDLGDYGAWMMISLAPMTALFALHLTAGILSVRYSRWAPNLMTAYAILALVLIAVDCIIIATTFPGGTQSRLFDDLAGPRLGLAFIATPWPIVALVLMNLRGTRDACKAPPG